MSRRGREFWTPERVARLAELWQRGLHAKELAEFMGVTVSAIEHARAHFGLAPRYSRKGKRCVRRPKPKIVIMLPVFERVQVKRDLLASEIPWPDKKRLMARR